MTFIIAFLGGIITFISPCVLPLIPIYIAYISGMTVQQLKDETKPVFKIFINSLFFVLGFAAVFSALAALFYIFVQSLGSYKIWFNRIAGLILIVFGLHIIRIIKIPFLDFEIKLKTETKKINVFSSLLIGMVFGAGWTPCIGPILSGILFTSSSSQNPLLAVLLLITYSLGLGIPFILTGLLTHKLLSLFDAIKKHYRIIELISGAFLIILGLILFFDWMGFLSGYFSKIFPFLNNIETQFVK